MSASLNLDMTTKVWHSALPAGINKTVLLCFCRHLNDGSALSWPGIARVAKMCGMSERTVQLHVRALERAGILLPRHKRVGCTTKYAIDLSSLAPLQLAGACEPSAAVDNATPAVSAPPPADCGLPPPQIAALTPADSSPITVLNLEKNSTRTAAPALPDTVMMIDGVKPQTLADFAAIRRKKKLGELNATALEALCSQAALAGITLQDALATCCSRNWGRFEAAWLATGPALSLVSAPARPAGPPPERAKLAAPEVAAAGRQRLSLIRQTPPAPVPPVAGIQVGATGPGWAHRIVNKHRAGQPVGHAALREACTALRITPASLGAARLH